MRPLRSRENPATGKRQRASPGVLSAAFWRWLARPEICCQNKRGLTSPPTRA